MAYRILFFAYLAAIVFAVTSCKNNNQNDEVTINNACVNAPNNCQGYMYQQSPGFTTYNYNYSYNGYNNGYYQGAGGPFYYLNNSSYLCNCPSGTMPTYNSYSGLGCVQSNLVAGQGYYSGYSYYSWGANNNQWMNIPQISNMSGYSSNGCYNGVVQSCLVGDVSTCSTGYTCRATSAASRLGLCVSNSANSQYGQIYR